MKNIRKQVEHLLNNYDIKNRLSLQGEGAEVFVDDLLALISKPRTEQEILKDFEKLGYKIAKNSDNILTMHLIISNVEHNTFAVFKSSKDFFKKSIIKNRECVAEITLQEYKLLNELFECWGWI